MAEDPAQDKTEQPTGKREEQYREEGQVARSMELTTVAVIIAFLMAMKMMGDTLFEELTHGFRFGLTVPHEKGLDPALQWAGQFAWPALKTLLLIFLTYMFAAIAMSMAQTGVLLSWKALSPKFERVNPLEGVKRLFSMQAFVQFIKNFLKVTVIGFIIYSELNNRMEEMYALTDLALGNALTWTMSLLSIITLKVSIFLGVLAAGDYGYQWYSLRQQMMMTKQEVKDEMKESQVSEHVRTKVRRIAQERAKKSLKMEVPKADVIITNPTHFAVAIRYRRGVDKAPQVLAKGADLLAKTIRNLAEENRVPLYEYPELARKLYRTVKVGAYVPFDLYEAIAKVLTFVYRLNRKRRQLRVY